MLRADKNPISPPIPTPARLTIVFARLNEHSIDYWRQLLKPRYVSASEILMGNVLQSKATEKALYVFLSNMMPSA